MTKGTKPAFTERELAVVHTAVRTSDWLEDRDNWQSDEWKRLQSFAAGNLNHMSGFMLDWFTTRSLDVLYEILRDELARVETRVNEFILCVDTNGVQGLSDWWWRRHGEDVSYEHVTRENFVWSNLNVTQEFEESLETMGPLTSAMCKVGLLAQIDSEQYQAEARAFNEAR